MEHLDVLIIGAGLSGIGAACHLQAEHPRRSYAILESREAIGGTWDLFRYPGVRSDSDMHTLGYSFRPWQESTALADGASILRYVRETAREHGVEERIRFGHRVVRAEFSSEQAAWVVSACLPDGEEVQMRASFLVLCTGYYRYDSGYAPRFPGLERFRGTVVHPQHWPEDLDHADRRVVVIGSGATAVTLVPAMAEAAAHVTMLQRSPSYVVSIPGQDPLADWLRHRVSPETAYRIVRAKNVVGMTLLYQLSRRRPGWVRRAIRAGTQRALPPGYDIDPHFKPTYNPWDQRMCFVPDGDLFKSVCQGRASVVTDRIETFTEDGIRLASGAELEADIVVTATGLQLLALGGISLWVDGREVNLPDTMTYKGTMLSGVPSLALLVGYTNASWTLKADLSARYVCRLLRYMDEHGYAFCVPIAPGPEVGERPLIELTSSYVLRSVDQFPRQGSKLPWRLFQNYFLDRILLGRGAIADTGLEFRRRQPPATGDAALSADPAPSPAATPAGASVA